MQLAALQTSFLPLRGGSVIQGIPVALASHGASVILLLLVILIVRLLSLDITLRASFYDTGRIGNDSLAFVVFFSEK